MRHLFFLLLLALALSLPAQETMLYPVPEDEDSYTTRGFNYQMDGDSHTGLDIVQDYSGNNPGNYDTPVLASYSGFVHHVQDMYSETDACGGTRDHGMGRNVILRVPMADGQTTLYISYSHLQTTTVSIGDAVYRGQYIGTIGNSGYNVETYWTCGNSSCDDYSWGHIHLETRVKSVSKISFSLRGDFVVRRLLT